MKENVIKMPFNVKRANENFIKAFIRLGYLYTDENGIHVSDKRGK